MSVVEKDAFYNEIISFVAAVPNEEMLLTSRSFNGHIHELSVRFEGVHGSNGSDKPRLATWFLSSQQACCC